MLDALHPFPFVFATVCPDHAAVAAPLIVYVFALVNVTTGPFVCTSSILLVVTVGSFVTIAALSFGATPPTLTMF